MLMVNIADAKAKLSEYIDAVVRGERVIICSRNKPVAELMAIAQPAQGPRDLAPMFPGHTFMTDAFFEPMTEDELREWYGGPVLPAKVGEKPPVYGKPTKRQRRK